MITWRLNSMIKNQWGNPKGNFKKIPWDKWQWKHKHTKSMGRSKSSYKRENYSNIGFHQKARKISHK